MTERSFNPQNILVTHFGQMGDVILGLPAFKAIRQRFPAAQLTILAGKSAAAVAGIAGVFDEEIIVDRVELRDGNQLRSIQRIFKLAREIRRRKFDFIIDLHSLSETNILGFLSGARRRLYANRENRSIDFLANFSPRPPLEDKDKHLSERYLDVLRPLGIENVSRFVKIEPRAEDVAEIKELLQDLGAGQKTLIGLFLGAGHPSRRWSLDRFAELTEKFAKREDQQVLIFLGPEELDLLDEVNRKFPPPAIILDKLKLLPLFAAASLLRVLISNDTGPMHLGAVAGASIVLISDRRAPSCFWPLTEKLEVVKSGEISEISAEEVFQAAGRFLDDENAL